VVTKNGPQGRYTSTIRSVNTITPPAGQLNSGSEDHSSGFFNDSGAVGGTFAAVGIVVVGLLAAFIWFMWRRRKAKRMDADVVAAASAAAATTRTPFEDDDHEFGSDNPYDPSPPEQHRGLMGQGPMMQEYYSPFEDHGYPGNATGYPETRDGYTNVSTDAGPFADDGDDDARQAATTYLASSTRHSPPSDEQQSSAERYAGSQYDAPAVYYGGGPAPLRPSESDASHSVRSAYELAPQDQPPQEPPAAYQPAASAYAPPAALYEQGYASEKAPPSQLVAGAHPAPISQPAQLAPVAAPASDTGAVPPLIDFSESPEHVSQAHNGSEERTDMSSHERQSDYEPPALSNAWFPGAGGEQGTYGYETREGDARRTAEYVPPLQVRNGTAEGTE